MVSDQDDAVWYDSATKLEQDIDELFEIGGVKEIALDPEDNHFYFLANRRYGHLGFYLIRFDAKKPKEFKFLTSWRNNLEIGDASIFVLRGKDSKMDGSGYFKELVVSYKTIYINTYNIVLTDLAGEDEKSNTLYRFEPH